MNCLNMAHLAIFGMMPAFLISCYDDILGGGACLFHISYHLIAYS